MEMDFFIDTVRERQKYPTSSSTHFNIDMGFYLQQKYEIIPAVHRGYLGYLYVISTVDRRPELETQPLVRQYFVSRILPHLYLTIDAFSASCEVQSSVDVTTEDNSLSI
jgi:hypothetical protein